MRKGDTGSSVAALQRLLNTAGFKLAADGWFGDSTEAAVIAIQRRAGLVADGVAGPKTLAALSRRERDPRHLGERDLAAAAERLGVPAAAIKAVNAVESRGAGFLEDGRPVILYERHQAFRLLGEAGMPYDEACALAARYPALISQQRGGYAGGSAEWARLASACQVIDPAIARAACSWGLFQIMGYHAPRLGYASIDEFVSAMQRDEAAQLDAFVRFILAEPALHKALKARKWDSFAKLYNGPAYRENLYDVKLARAFERYTEPEEAAA